MSEGVIIVIAGAILWAIIILIGLWHGKCRERYYRTLPGYKQNPNSKLCRKPPLKEADDE